ncbi:hypothetical protein ES703_99342 [subsurface metagenome]
MHLHSIPLCFMRCLTTPRSESLQPAVMNLAGISRKTRDILTYLGTMDLMSIIKFTMVLTS